MSVHDVVFMLFLCCRWMKAVNVLLHVNPGHSLLLLLSIFRRIRSFSNELALCIKWPQYLSIYLHRSSSPRAEARMQSERPRGNGVKFQKEEC